jgi:hypothetical protein
MKAKARIEPRRTKLPPILEIDEDGIPVADFEPWRQTRWTSDEDSPGGLQLDDWPSDLDD